MVTRVLLLVSQEGASGRGSDPASTWEAPPSVACAVTPKWASGTELN